MELKVYSKVSKREPAEKISIQAYVETQYPVMLHNATERQHTNCFVYWKRVIFLQLVLNVRKLSIFYYIYFNSEITQWMLQNVYLNKTNIYIHSVLSYKLFQKETGTVAIDKFKPQSHRYWTGVSVCKWIQINVHTPFLIIADFFLCIQSLLMDSVF